MINVDVTVTEKAREYIAKASELIAKNNGKPAIAIWAERIHAWGGSRVEINVDVYTEKEILEAEGFESKGNLNGTNVPLYIQKAAYPFLPEKLNVEQSGSMYKRLYLTDVFPERCEGRC